MGIGRSTFYDAPDARASDAIIVAEMKTICDQFEAYGYRRVDAELRHRGIVVNAKKIRRLMREHALNPKQRRRFIATTDSDHNYPIFPDLAKNMMPDSPNQLWVADITYLAVATGFVYLAAILDAWSRRVVGYAISRSIDARLVVAALKVAISARNPPRGCVHHSDRGSQYASEDYHAVLREHGLKGSMGREFPLLTLNGHCGGVHSSQRLAPRRLATCPPTPSRPRGGNGMLISVIAASRRPRTIKEP